MFAAFAKANPEPKGELVAPNAFTLLVGIVVILGLGTATRFYFVSWIGERVPLGRVSRNTRCSRWSSYASRRISDFVTGVGVPGGTVPLTVEMSAAGDGAAVTSTVADGSMTTTSLADGEADEGADEPVGGGLALVALHAVMRAAPASTTVDHTT